MRLAQNLEVSTFRLYYEIKKDKLEVKKKTKFPIDAGSEGHNTCMTDAVIRDTI